MKTATLGRVRNFRCAMVVSLILLGSVASPTTFGLAPFNDAQAGVAAVSPTGMQAQSSASFERNMGQWDEAALYKVHAAGTEAFLTRNGLVTVLTAPQNDGDAPQNDEMDTLSLRDVIVTNQTAVELTFEGAASAPIIKESFREARVSNYLIGNDPTAWTRQVPHFRVLTFENLYEGIDVRYYGDDDGRLKYDFIVHPGADPNDIRLRFHGQDRLEVNSDGTISIVADVGTLHQGVPLTFQAGTSGKVTVPNRYVLHSDGAIGFALGPYHLASDLVVDPLVYSTYIGGPSYDASTDVAVDASGNAYIVGYTESTSFPTTIGGYQTTFGGPLRDAYLAKLNPSGTSLVYSTYLGGSSIDEAHAVAVDSSGNPYLALHTWSENLPTTAGAYQTTKAGSYDVYVAKLDSSGSTLLYATYLGGTGIEQVEGVAVDALGSAYLTGRTASTNFPITAGAHQILPVGSDVFFARFNAAGSMLIYSTYLGGSSSDIGYGIALDASANAYIAGTTESMDFPTTVGSFQLIRSGGSDAFVAKFSASNGALLPTHLEYSTYVGGSNTDQGFALAVDSFGNAYLAGRTRSTGFPTTANAFQMANAGAYDAFVAQLEPTGSSLIYSTYLGGSNDDAARGVALGPSGSIYVAGDSMSVNYPMAGDPYQDFHAGGITDAVLTRFDPNPSTLAYSTYFGGSKIEQPAAMAADSSGNAYIVGIQFLGNLPTSAGAFDTSYEGGSDGFAAKIATAGPLSAGSGIMSIDQGRPACYGAGFVPPPSSHCNSNPYGFTDDVVFTGDRTHSFAIDWGDFNRHDQVRCGSSECLFRFDLDLHVSSPGQDFSPFHGQTVPVAQLFRFDAASNQWVAVPGGAIDGVLLTPDGPAEWGLHLPERLLLSADAMGTADGSSQFRLVAADRPGATGQPWTFELYAVKAELVAPPVVLVHGWPPKPYATRADFDGESAGWADEFRGRFIQQATMEFGQSPWSWAVDRPFRDFEYNGKNDFRETAIPLYNQLLELQADPSQGIAPDVSYEGPVDIVAHSFGGLVSRYLVEQFLPRLDEAEGGTKYDAERLVADIVMMGTPNLGSKWADAYVKGLDKKELAMSRVFGFGDSDHYYWARDGTNVFTWRGPWHESQDWWYDSVQSYRNWDTYADRPHQSMMADFELTPAGGNPILDRLDLGYGTPGIHYFHVAGDMNPNVCKPNWLGGGCHRPDMGGKLGDFIVSLASATRNQENQACHQFYTDHGGRSQSLSWPLVSNAAHDQLPFQTRIQDDALAFISGQKTGVCANTPSYPASSGESLGAAMMFTSSATPDDEGLEVAHQAEPDSVDGTFTLRVTWTAPGNSNGTVLVEGFNETLQNLNATLRTPGGAIATLAGGNETWATWDGPTNIGSDGLFRLKLPEAAQGNWTLWLNLTGNSTGFMAPTVLFDTPLRLRVDSGHEGLVNQPLTYRVAVTNASTPVPGAIVTLSFMDTTAGGVQNLTLVDDGTGADTSANDGVYAANYTFSRKGVYAFQVNATTGTSKLTGAGVTSIMVTPEDASKTCGQSLLASNETIIQSILEQDTGFLLHCLTEGDLVALAGSVVATVRQRVDETLA